jgi:hypothetical protein
MLLFWASWGVLELILSNMLRKIVSDRDSGPRLRLSAFCHVPLSHKWSRSCNTALGRPLQKCRAQPQNAVAPETGLEADRFHLSPTILTATGTS